jgi:small-conductance mechanosensitive channel
VIVTAALAALPRLLLSDRLAELQQAKLQKKPSVLRSKKMSLFFLISTAVFGTVYFALWRSHELWLEVAIVFSVLSTAEFFLQARFPSLDSLIFQNRLLGILYLGLSIGSYVLLRRL